MSNHVSLAKDERPIQFLFENSLFLIFGTIAALIWANTHPESHERFFYGFQLKDMFVEADSHDASQTHAGATDSEVDDSTQDIGDAEPGSDEAHSEGDATHDEHSGHHGITMGFLINDVLMALFFGIAGKEVWESMLPGGALSNPRKAAMPLLATLGGVVGPAALYCVGVLLFSTWATLGRGWAVPCATDIAFSYLVARIIFGIGHPAIAFLLLLAIADDAIGLVIIAVFYPQGSIDLPMLGICVGAIFLALIMRRARVQSFWWYLLIPGVLSWLSFYWAGIHPALGFVPIIPCMPHASTDLGIFAKQELNRDDTLNEFEHWWKRPVELILGLFGLCNAGVAFSSVGVGTWLVLFALLVGKPVGITLFTWIGEKGLKLELPQGMNYAHIISLGMVAGIGFTVALFVSTAAFPPNNPGVLNAVKMGALLSFGAAFLSIIIAKILKVERWTPAEASIIESE